MHSRRRNSSFSTVKQAERTSKHNSKSHVPSRSKQSESQNAVVPKTVKSEQRKAQIPEAGDHVQPEELPVLHMKHKQRTRWGESDGKRQPDENKPIRLSQEVTDRRLHSAEKETPTRRTHNTSNDQTEGKKIGGEQHSSVRKRGHHKDRSRTETFITAEQIKENTGEELANESKPKVELMDWHHLKKAKAETGLVVEFSSDLDRKVEKTSKVSQMSATPLITVHYESLSADQQGCTEDPEEYGSDFEVPNSGGSESDSLSGPTNIAKLSEFQTFGEPSLHYLWSFVTHQNVDQPSTPSGQVINEHSPDTKQLIDFSRSFGSTVRRSGQRLLRRAKNLLRLIELEFDGTGHVFELKPLDGYANYMVRFGKANHCQVHVQTNDDALDREAQTDEIELCKGGGVWTQWPPLDTGDCSGYASASDTA
ncbi:uncharacterized protein DEA37_0010136 [Paragonimus westermani]|uniref:Uncharacterized protein n=1 Tax=Paragonimus westermani TaxID=34504 RepID=A0A5J4P3I6_9TREM|nr:uncharacterized protein DEA37_0010136 [Paragonimus westermani]